jgi:hypothetical protein
LRSLLVQEKATNIWGVKMAIRRVIPEVLILAFLLLGAGVMAAQDSSSMPEGRIAGEIKQARDLLDSWSGQTDILDGAKEILDRVIEKDPQNHRALKELS